MREISEISVLGETFEVSDATARKFGVNTVYPIDIDKRGSGNNILYINVPGVKSYDDMDGKSVALNTGIYCVQWDEPQTVYININGLGSKALYRPLPTNSSSDYDDRQYNTAKYVKGEISRQQTLIVSFSGGTATLLNPAPAPRATKAIEAGSTDDVSYVTPKAVAEALRGIIKNLGNVTDANILNDCIGNRVYMGGFSCSEGDPDVDLPGIGRICKRDFVLKSYALHAYDYEDYIYQELYMANGILGSPITIYSRYYDYTLEDWTEFTNINPNPRGTYANPFVITDPGTDLATLVDKGVYYFDFGEKNNASVNAKGPAGSVYYINRCYMRVVPAVGSAAEQKGAHQILYGIYDDESVCLHRAVNAVEHRAVNEWHAALDYSKDDTYINRFNSVEARVDTLEKNLKNLKGTLSNPNIVTKNTLDVTWEPGYYICEFSPYGDDAPGETHIVEVSNFKYSDSEFGIAQRVVDSNGMRNISYSDAASYEDVFKNSIWTEWK